MGFPDHDMCVRGSVTFPSVYTEGSSVDANAEAGQKNVPLTATTAFTAGDRVILDRGGDREEEFVIASIDPGVKLVSVTDLVYNHTIDAATTTDAESAAEQKVLAVTSTTGFLAGETVLVDDGESHEATYVIDSVDSGVSLTMKTDLLFTHDAGEAVAYTGVSKVAEVAEAFLSEVISKGHYQNMSLFLPSDWTTAAITLLACDTVDGTYLQVVNADDVGELSVAASVAKSKCISLNGEIKEAMAALPFIKLRSGVLATPVDQGTDDIKIAYVLTR